MRLASLAVGHRGPVFATTALPLRLCHHILHLRRYGRRHLHSCPVPCPQRRPGLHRHVWPLQPVHMDHGFRLRAAQEQRDGERGLRRDGIWWGAKRS